MDGIDRRLNLPSSCRNRTTIPLRGGGADHDIAGPERWIDGARNTNHDDRGRFIVLEQQGYSARRVHFSHPGACNDDRFSLELSDRELPTFDGFFSLIRELELRFQCLDF